MGCQDGYCEVENEGVGPCKKCGGEPFIKKNYLSSWIFCKKCGRCITADTFEEAVSDWNAQPEGENNDGT